jgi:hypothetical protein
MIHGKTEDGKFEFIDAARAVTEYRRIIALRDAQTTEIDRSEYDRIANRLRAEWKAYSGADDLAELATGEDE